MSLILQNTVSCTCLDSYSKAQILGHLTIAKEIQLEHGSVQLGSKSLNW